MLALASAGPVLAAESDINLDSVIVTATRTAEPADAALASVSVITRADIDRLQPHSVAELLAGLPGVSIANSGGLGKTTSVFLRGTESDQLLVLIDGIRVGSATTGTAAFEQIPVDQIERIEIVRGPRSSLYGSGAIGGVIQIFTRKGDGTLTPSLSLSGGTYDTWRGQADLTGGDAHAWYSVSLAGLYTAGFAACRGAGAPIFAGCFVTEAPDKDGYWNTSGSVRAGYRFDNGLELSADWLRVYGDTQYDGDFVNSSKVVQQILGGTAKLPAVGTWQSSLSAGRSEDDSKDYENGVYVDTFNTRRTSVSWQNDFAFAPGHQMTAGIDYLRDHVVSDTRYAVTSREDVGVFAQYQGSFGPADAQLSLRDDHDQQFGEHYTGGAVAGYTLSDTLRITAAYGTAFKSPTFNELYFPGYGNPTLKPVNSRSAEIGLAGRPTNWNWALNAYETHVDDLITYDAAAGGPANVARARIRGLEGQLGANWSGWRNQLSVSLLDPRDRTPGDNDALLPRRARQTARYDIDRHFSRYSAGATWFESGRRFDDLANSAPLGGYSTLDVRAGWQLDQSWLLQLQLTNLFDKHYETAQYYNQPGRSVFVTLRYHPVTL
jgi:vitamin B12 transporter